MLKSPTNVVSQHDMNAYYTHGALEREAADDGPHGRTPVRCTLDNANHRDRISDVWYAPSGPH